MQTYRDAQCAKCKLTPRYHAATTHGTKVGTRIGFGLVLSEVIESDGHPFRFTGGGGNAKTQRR